MDFSPLPRYSGGEGPERVVAASKSLTGNSRLSVPAGLNLGFNTNPKPAPATGHREGPMPIRLKINRKEQFMATKSLRNAVPGPTRLQRQWPTRLSRAVRAQSRRLASNDQHLSGGRPFHGSSSPTKSPPSRRSKASGARSARHLASKWTISSATPSTAFTKTRRGASSGFPRKPDGCSPHQADFSFGSVTLQTRINAIYGAANKVLGYIVNWEDVSDRRRVEAEQSRLFSMLENSPTNVMLADRDLKITYVNPASLALLRKLERHLPVKGDNVLGSTIDIFHKNPAYCAAPQDPRRSPRNLPVRGPTSK